jgi:demethylmenaquinone methyltransferase/2-methoxy-6-polyprenyl-1,4-benzoquinol methylase
MLHDRNRHARQLFNGIARRYDLVAELGSLFQYGHWRRYLVSRLNSGPDDTVLDLCTGTAGVAIEVVRNYRSRVVGVDLSPMMLKHAQDRISTVGLADRLSLVMGRAESLAFPNACFDVVCVTFLLRYVDDPRSTMREIIRVLKPGGRLLSLEFGVPGNPVARVLWYAYTRAALPLGGALVSRGWRRVGSFLGPSVSRFCRSYPEERLRSIWVQLGISDVKLTRLSLGGAVVMWGTKTDQETLSD